MLSELSETPDAVLPETNLSKTPFAGMDEEVASEGIQEGVEAKMMPLL